MCNCNCGWDDDDMREARAEGFETAMDEVLEHLYGVDRTPEHARAARVVEQLAQRGYVGY